MDFKARLLQAQNEAVEEERRLGAAQLSAKEVGGDVRAGAGRGLQPHPGRHTWASTWP